MADRGAFLHALAVVGLMDHIDIDKLHFVSDTHFTHENLIQYYPARIACGDIDAVDEVMVDNWNRRIAPDDVVYHLGDVAHREPWRATRILRRLNGVKRLIVGNHDTKLIRDRKFRDEWDEIYPLSGESRFTTFAYSIKEIFVGVDNPQRIVLSHFPIWEWNAMHHGAWHLHGHVHGKPTGIPGKIMDVSVDGNGLAPVSFAEVKSFMDSRPVRTYTA